MLALVSFSWRNYRKFCIRFSWIKMFRILSAGRGMHEASRSSYLCCARSMVEVSKQDEDRLVWMEKIWRSKIPSELQVFSWRLLLNGFPTICQLTRREIIDGLHNFVFPLCFLHDEDSIHQFLNCVVSRQVWEGVCLWIGILMVENCTSLAEHVVCLCS